MRVGLTGGIGSGKSAAGKVFADLGALVIDADRLARDAVAPSSAGLAALGARWPAVVRSDGSLDRPALAQIIFHDEPARAFVNGLVHPVVRARSAEIERTAAADQIVVHEIPLLFETGFAEQCDATIVVIAPRELRIARAMARNDVTRDEVERRIAAQIDPADARSLADYVIENDGTLDGLRERTERVYRSLQAR